MISIIITQVYQVLSLNLVPNDWFINPVLFLTKPYKTVLVLDSFSTYKRKS